MALDGTTGFYILYYYSVLIFFVPLLLLEILNAKKNYLNVNDVIEDVKEQQENYNSTRTKYLPMNSGTPITSTAKHPAKALGAPNT